MKWQILIATTIDRRNQFELLIKEFERQIEFNNLKDKIEIIHDEDNKEKTIGKKRQDLLELSTAEYINYFDSDDWPYNNYISDIYNGLMNNPDCIGMTINMTTNGERPQTCCHSLQYKIWENNKGGYDFVRNVTHFNPIKRELAIQAAFSDKRYGEDKEYSDNVTKLCHYEIFIDQPLFHYRYSTEVPHEKKYGII